MELLKDIKLEDYNYDLPAGRVALYPAGKRDGSRLLVRNADGALSGDLFCNLPGYIEKGSCMVFNNSKVIPVRLFFNNPAGKRIELLCLRPAEPDTYTAALQATGGCTWECLVGNPRQFKDGTLTLPFHMMGSGRNLMASKAGQQGNPSLIRFTWDDPSLSFGEILDQIGRTPLPPYIKRDTVQGDRQWYQTVYARYEGSVAAPTAGLHFTREVLGHLEKRNVRMPEVTLHVGAGTFLPVKSHNVTGHTMHSEFFSVSRSCIETLIGHGKPVVAVGTTSVRTLESLYWLGVRLLKHGNMSSSGLRLSQWEAWQLPRDISLQESLQAIHQWLLEQHEEELKAETRLMIVPGYRFRTVDTLITNFHQPKSSLLLLVAAFIGNSWKDVYRHALDNGFRFLSYGDSSILFTDPGR